MSGADHGSLAERFFRGVCVGDPEDCWEWQKYICRSTGYGRLSDSDGRTKIQAHRVSWRLHHGEIPQGMLVRHTCDNRRCVNPSHLLLGTQADNVRDMIERNRQGGWLQPGHTLGGVAMPADERRRRNTERMGRQKTHCKYGHQLPPYQPGRLRRCRVCYNGGK